METYTRDLKTKGVTLDTDSSAATRLSERPAQRRGAAFEDFGSDFSKRSSSRASQSRWNERTNSQASSSKRTVIEISDDLSDDELDFLSSSSRHGSVSPVKPKKQVKKAETPSATRPPLSIVIDHHQSSSNYKPLDLKSMKIPKKSSSISSIAGPSRRSRNSQLSSAAAPRTSDSSGSGRNVDAASVRDSKLETHRAMRDEKTERSLRERSPKQVSTRPSESHFQSSNDRDEEQGETDKTPRASTYRGTTGRISKWQTDSDLRTRSSQTNAKNKEKNRAVDRSQSLVDVLDSLRDREHDQVSDDVDPPGPFKGKTRETVATRPRANGDAKTKRKVKTSGKGKQRAENPIDALFGEQSPPKRSARPVKRTLSEFPMPSLRSSPTTSRATSPQQQNQPKRQYIVLSSDEEGSDLGGRSVKPFPMETQLLETLNRVSPAKRTAATSDLEDPGGACWKRPRRVSREKKPDSFGLEDAESDSDPDDIFLDPSVDPSTLCPWCDERLPSNPTPYLTSLIEGARRRSYPDDRPTNPLGLRAPPMVFVTVCQRHRFERVWIPRARRRGWPTRIDWGSFRGRIEKLEDKLRAIVDDVDEDFVPGAQVRPSTSGKERARSMPRKENEFWQEVVQNVRQQGSRQTAGVRGQFLHFNKTQPGYYGELGYMIIHQTLCDLFPPASFDPAAALPLTPADFIAHVLVPEAALNLIMEDLNLSREDALKTLRDSVEYGVAMFPVDEGENGKGDEDSMIMGAGEQMIMERARVRRKELEEEERKEEEERSAHDRARQTDTEPEMDIDVDDAPPPSSESRKPRPRPVAKAKPYSSQKPKAPVGSRARFRSRAPESDCEIVPSSSDAGYRSDVSRSAPSMKRRAVRVSPLSARSDTPSENAGVHGIASHAKPKPRPRPIGRSGMASSSQSDIAGRKASKDIRHLPETSDDDGPLPLTQPRASASSRRKEVRHTNHAETEASLDATPRPKPRAVSKASHHRSPKQSVPEKAPLHMARERRHERTASSKTTHTDGWLPNLRAASVMELDSTDDDAKSGRPGPSSKLTEPRRTFSRSSKNGSERWDWLLSDDSSSSSRTPSFTHAD
ncbi:hypothetical protein BN946_scf184851.g49 [Trametes cinnabarina]|uniref:Restriction of telomere capping protein 4 n=1 Tax=Pycnoporus cinnabarinus TaxID=5643 RepID=A0A060S617_PYCCI|nr:hypothetical protein BN946_scf184851.g49 [Trametes cinnabarina]